MSQKAIVIQSSGDARVVANAPIPKLRDDYIIVKVAAVAINPADWQSVDMVAEAGPILGCDYSGTVEQVGKSVSIGLKPGDRVAGLVHGADVLNHDFGAFAEYITAKGDCQIKLPDQLSFEAAATLGMGIMTAAQALYQSLGLPLPTKPGTKLPVLIYGGSTATGQRAIEFAKLSGLDVITTCSEHNIDLVKSLGADYAFDYKSPACATNIRSVSNNDLRYVFDCISLEGSVKICADAIVEGGTYTSLRPVEHFPKQNVANKMTVAYTGLGETFKFGDWEVPAKKEDFEFAVKFTAIARELLDAGKIKPLRRSVRSGGLQGVLDGLEESRHGKVSGEKLVYPL